MVNDPKFWNSKVRVSNLRVSEKRLFLVGALSKWWPGPGFGNHLFLGVRCQDFLEIFAPLTEAQLVEPNIVTDLTFVVDNTSFAEASLAFGLVFIIVWVGSGILASTEIWRAS